jgi:hypothetical protein
MWDRRDTYPLEIDSYGGTELQTGTDIRVLSSPELVICSIYIRFGDAIPFLGGAVFGAISSIRNGDRALYEFTLPLKSHFVPQEPNVENRFLGISSILHETKLDLDYSRQGFPVRIMAQPVAGVFDPVLQVTTK